MLNIAGYIDSLLQDGRQERQEGEGKEGGRRPPGREEAGGEESGQSSLREACQELWHRPGHPAFQGSLQIC